MAPYLFKIFFFISTATLFFNSVYCSRSRILQPIDFPCYTFHCIFQLKRLFDDHVVLILTALNNECGSLGYEPYYR